MDPLVSVLIPCFNAERFIAETLLSVVAQTYRSLEIIVVDDGSLDRTAEIVRNLAVPGLTFIAQENRGASAARNAAFVASRGDYVQFLDADDLISPEKISLQLDRLIQEPEAVATCRWGRFFDLPEQARFDPVATWNDLLPVDWLVENWSEGGGMCLPAMWLLPRQVVLRAGLWREDLSLNDDGEFFTRIVLASRRVLYCPNATAYYRSGVRGSLSGIKSVRGFQSGYKAIELCIEAALKFENSERVRRCGSKLFQVFAHGAYPYHRKLANDALRHAHALHPVEVSPSGGLLFRMVRGLFGWKVAQSVRKWLGRI